MSANSVWSKYLRKEEDQRYARYYDLVAYKAEVLISDITADLLFKSEGYSTEIAKKMAINLLMEQLLKVQHEETPDSQVSMLLNLFIEHPSLSDVRSELYSYIETKNKPVGFIQKIKFLFSS